MLVVLPTVFEFVFVSAPNKTPASPDVADVLLLPFAQGHPNHPPTHVTVFVFVLDVY